MDYETLINYAIRQDLAFMAHAIAMDFYDEENECEILEAIIAELCEG